MCPGASLARLEGRVALGVFLDRVAEIRPVDPGAYEEVPVMWAHGPQRLLVELSARLRSATTPAQWSGRARGCW